MAEFDLIKKEAFEAVVQQLLSKDAQVQASITEQEAKVNNAIDTQEARVDAGLASMLSALVDEFSGVVGTKPTITGADGTTGAYFPSSQALQRLIEDNGEWLNDGEPVLTVNALDARYTEPKFDNFVGDSHSAGMRGMRTSGIEAELWTPELDTSGNVGEGWQGACTNGKIIAVCPQDFEYFIFIDAISRKVIKLVDASFLTRVSDAGSTRDKMNGSGWDGRNWWFTPSWAGSAVKIHGETYEVTEIEDVNTHGDDAYNGLKIVGDWVYMITHDAPDLVRIHVTDLTVERLVMPNGGDNDYSVGDNAFLSSVLIGTSLYLLPRESKKLVEIDTLTFTIKADYEHPMADTDVGVGFFHGGGTNGRYIWLTPFKSTKLCRFDTYTKSWISEDHGLTTDNASLGQYCLGGADLGRFLIMINYRAEKAIWIDKFTLEWKTVDIGVPVKTCNGGVRVGNEVWFIPAGTEDDFYIIPVIDEGVAGTETTKPIRTADKVVAGSRNPGSTGAVVLASTAPGTIIAESDTETDAVINDTEDGLVFDDGNALIFEDLDLDFSGGATLLFRFKTNVDDAGDGRLFSIGSGTGHVGGIGVYLTKNWSAPNEAFNKAVVMVLDGGSASGVALFSNANVIVEDQEHVLAIRFNGVIRDIRIDGDDETRDRGDEDAIPGAAYTDPLIIGNIDLLTRNFPGEIFEIQFFTRQLTNGEIDDWEAGTLASQANSVFYYKPDSDTVYEAPDPNGYYWGNEEEDGTIRRVKNSSGIIEQKRISGKWVKL